MTCVHIEAACKTPDEIRDYSFNWINEAFAFWISARQFDAGGRVRPSVANGFEYECTVPGQTTQSTEETDAEPTWPTTLGATVTDGSITWTCVAISTSGLHKSIANSTWTAESVDVTVEDSSFVARPGEQTTSVKVSGGTDGEVYDVVNHVTFSDGTELDAIVRLTVEDEAD